MPPPTKEEPKQRFGEPIPVYTLQVLDVGKTWYMKIGEFVQTQEKISLQTKNEDLTLVNYAVDEKYLELVKKDFSAATQEIDFSNKDLTERLTRVIEAMIWIYYLGDPDYWYLN